MILLYMLLSLCANLNGMEINQRELAESARRDAMPLLLAISENDAELLKIAEILAQNLQRSGQFKVTIKPCHFPTTQTELDTLLDKNYPLEIFLSQGEQKSSIAWRLYDVRDGKLVKGMKYAKRGKLIHGYADNLADELWPILTRQASSFSSKIGYVKRKRSLAKKQRSVVCIANSDGSHEQEIIKTPGTYVSLYWHHDKSNPCLYCSEFTRFNVRLVSANLLGRKNVILNFKGTCVGISVAHDNNNAVYCRSGTIWQYNYDSAQQKGAHKPLIKNDGKNVSPTLLENGDIIFCSDARSIRQGNQRATGPQICRYRASEKSISLLTTDGYCVGPSYCAHNQKIAYSKKVNGVMQLCIYNCRTKDNQQITFDGGNKIDCCWSPCGNFVVFCYQLGRDSRIAVMHVGLKKRTFLTPVSEHCTCPSWSPVYSVVPTMR